MDVLSISQVFNLFLVYAEVVRDFMYQCDANLLAQFGGILEITNQGIGEDRDLVGQDGRIDRRAFRQGGAFIETIEHVTLRIETHRYELTFFGSLLDHDLHVVKTAAKLLGQPVQYLGNLLLNLFLLQ